ncbi:hypothetical protein PLICRDRAFT_42574 [Plicaturopsis crispa FD-325 SS-3]|nr:hypothetical protein PLICRDRAFT_42574 [Plicaturopsis crispa FD-325 SS-3]
MSVYSRIWAPLFSKFSHQAPRVDEKTRVCMHTKYRHEVLKSLIRRGSTQMSHQYVRSKHTLLEIEYGPRRRVITIVLLIGSMLACPGGCQPTRSSLRG